MTKIKTVCGFGINDANYEVQTMCYSEGKVVRVHTCPYYSRWYDMIRRCYNKRALSKRNSYEKVTVCEDWAVFSKFKDWMSKQDWENKVLDKDLLSGIEYSPTTCLFIPESVNVFIKDRVKNKANKRGSYYHSRDKVYESYCSNQFTKRLEYLSRFKNEDDAHNAWKVRKLELCLEFHDRGIINKTILDLLVDYIYKVV